MFLLGVKMKLNRRDFLAHAVLFSAGAAAAEPLDNILDRIKKNHEWPFSIMQGVTNETTTQIAVSMPSRISAQFELVDADTNQKFAPQVLKKSTRNFSDETVYLLFFEGLQLGSNYLFRVISNSNTILDERELKALNTQNRNARVALLSCMNDYAGQNIEEMWSAVKQSNPDFIVMLGDNVYGDVLVLHGPKVLWNRYVDTRRNLPFYHFRKLIPTIAIWDDHDFGKNDVMGDYQYRTQSFDIFNSFYAQAAVSEFYEKGPGISSSCELFGHRFIFLDGRYFRAPSSNPARAQFLGLQQIKWFSEQVANSQSSGYFVCLGSQFFGEYQSKKQSYQSLGGDEFETFKGVLSSANKPVIFASGDVHYSEVQRVSLSQAAGLTSYEVTSSCMHSFENPKMDKNTERLAGTLKNNFVFIDFKNDGTYQVTCLGATSERFSETMSF